MNHIPYPPGASPTEALSIGKRVLAELIARAEPMGEGWRLPILQAAYRDLINFSISQGGTPFPARFFELTRPTIGVIADDHPGAIGPAAWPQARRLFRWVNVAILHAAGGTAGYSERLTDWEAGFLADLSQRRMVSPKQAATLARIMQKMPMGGAA
jgi:hypothetical protein